MNMVAFNDNKHGDRGKKKNKDNESDMGSEEEDQEEEDQEEEDQEEGDQEEEDQEEGDQEEDQEDQEEEEDDDDDDEEDEDEEDIREDTTPASDVSDKRQRNTSSFSTYPKKGMAGFFHYAKENRAKYDERLTFGKMAEKLMEDYSSLSKNERDRWDLKALNAGITYKDEMNNFGDAHPPYKRKREKDPNAPRRNMSPFMIFNSENREKIKKDNPNASFGDIAKKMAEAFHAMSPEERQILNDKATKDRQRYYEEMEAYKALQQANDELKEESD